MSDSTLRPMTQAEIWERKAKQNAARIRELEAEVQRLTAEAEIDHRSIANLAEKYNRLREAASELVEACEVGGSKPYQYEVEMSIVGKLEESLEET